MNDVWSCLHVMLQSLATLGKAYQVIIALVWYLRSMCLVTAENVCCVTSCVLVCVANCSVFASLFIHDAARIHLWCHTAAAVDAADVEHVVLVLGIHTNTTVEKGACQTVKRQLLTDIQSCSAHAYCITGSTAMNLVTITTTDTAVNSQTHCWQPAVLLLINR